MKREYVNTIKGIEADLAKGKRKVKDIAAECAIFADQADEVYPAVVFAFMAKCKTRKEFKEVIEAIEW